MLLRPLQNYPPLADDQHLGQCEIPYLTHSDLARDGDLLRHRYVAVQLRGGGVGAWSQRDEVSPRLVRRRRGHESPIAPPTDDCASELGPLALGVGDLTGHWEQDLFAHLLGGCEEIA